MLTKIIIFLLFALIKLLEADDWALLTETLRNYETGGCENQHLVLSCPGFTRITVYNAAYQDTPSCRLANESCDYYSPTPQRAVDNCHKKSNCLFLPSDSSQCQTYVRLMYKCQPNEFNSRVACENDQVSLSCSANQRLAVFRASFGRTQYESASCPQLQGVPEETCLVSYATETFMQICHGKRNCSFTANTETFSKPSCKHHSRLYLKIVYACVPRKVIQQKHASKLEEDESSEKEELLSLKTKEHNKTKSRELLTNTTDLSTSFPQEIRNDSTFTYMLYTTEPTSMNSLKNKSSYIDFMVIYKIHKYLTCNRGKVILFISLSITGGLLSVLIYLAVRFLRQKYKKKKKDKEEILDETLTLPNISENISEFDNEIDPDPDLTIIDTPISVLPYHLNEDYFNHTIPAEVVRYTDEGTKPRSLGLGHFYYS